MMMMYSYFCLYNTIAMDNLWVALSTPTFSYSSWGKFLVDTILEGYINNPLFRYNKIKT